MIYVLLSACRSRLVGSGIINFVSYFLRVAYFILIHRVLDTVSAFHIVNKNLTYYELDLVFIVCMVLQSFTKFERLNLRVENEINEYSL